MLPSMTAGQLNMITKFHMLLIWIKKKKEER